MASVTSWGFPMGIPISVNKAMWSCSIVLSVTTGVPGDHNRCLKWSQQVSQMVTTGFLDGH